MPPARCIDVLLARLCEGATSLRVSSPRGGFASGAILYLRTRKPQDYEQHDRSHHNGGQKNQVHDRVGSHGGRDPNGCRLE
ncbi:hypothetical protein MRX96_009275 [Rhipicephalus microplus]